MDSLTKQGVVVGHIEQALAGRIFGIEQTDIHLLCIQLEVMAQHTIVKQHLHKVSLSEALPLLARLLLHQQAHIAGHQVHTTSQT